MRTYVKPVLLFLCTCLGAGSCICGDLERNSGLDPANDTRIKGTPVESDSTLTVSLYGEYASGFRYRIDGGAWNEVHTDVITLRYADLELDEGTHTVSVVMVNENGVQDGTPEVITFTVDLVKSTALLLKPRVLHVRPGDPVHVQVMLEELEEDYLNGGSFSLTYDTLVVKVDSIGYNPFMGTVVMNLDTVYADRGRTAVNFVTSPQQWNTVDGSGPVLDVYLTAAGTGTAGIGITGALLKTAVSPATDSVSARVPLMIGGRVVVE